MATTFFELNNGLKLPSIGLGTFQGTKDNSQVKDVVLRALKMGYRHIDGATAYPTEMREKSVKQSRKVEFLGRKYSLLRNCKFRKSFGVEGRYSRYNPGRKLGIGRRMSVMLWMRV